MASTVRLGARHPLWRVTGWGQLLTERWRVAPASPPTSCPQALGKPMALGASHLRASPSHIPHKALLVLVHEPRTASEKKSTALSIPLDRISRPLRVRVRSELRIACRGRYRPEQVRDREQETDALPRVPKMR